jgi:DNA polymerase (family 10)
MKVSRHAVAAALEEIARYLDLAETNQFRANAYRRAARGIEHAEGDLRELSAAGALIKLPGIGKGIAPIITELIEEGRSRYLQELRASYPSGIFELLRVPNLGLKKIMQLHAELGVNNLADLEAACRDGKLQKLRGFGKKTEESICGGISNMSDAPTRWLLPKGLGAAQRLSEVLAEMRGIERVEISGEIRRRLETISGIEICVAAAKPAAALKQIAAIDLLAEAAVKDQHVKALYRDFPTTITVVKPERFEAALFITTGSDEFVAWAAAEAEKEKLSVVEMASEEELFDAIGIRDVVPELRESAPKKSKLPRRLIEREDLLGTFHVHTTYSDGRDTLQEMLAAAVERGFQYVGISDHSKTAGYAGGLTEARVKQQQSEIERLRSEFDAIRIFRGSEVDILLDGSLDYERDTLATFDFTVASIHSRFKMEKDEMTERMCQALRNPFVTFLGHLTGRKLLTRPGYQLDTDKVFEVAGKHGVMIEINANPNRLDIDWRLMQRALDRGVLFSIHPDAHSTEEYDHLITGIWHARKGSIEPKHVFNTLDVEAVEEYLKKRRERALKLTA